MDVYVFELLTFAIVCTSLCSSQSTNETIALVNDVLRNYDKRIRPTSNQSQPTRVSAYAYILNIDEFNEVEGRFSISSLLYLSWRDQLIKWDPVDYGGITSHMFSTRDVWHPELFMAYQTGKVDSYVKDWMNVRISYNGLSLFTLVTLFQSTCSVDITYYPFDTQECDIVLMPIGYATSEIFMEAPISTVMTYFFTEHGGWELTDTESISNNGNSLIFKFKLKRKPLFFVVNIILPIMLMSVLSSLIFALPPQSGERVSYGITVLLAIAVFLTLVGENLPKTSSPMSVLSYYLMFNLAVSTTMCIVAILNLRLYFYDGDDPIPLWLRCIISATCTRRCCRRIEDKTKDVCKTDAESQRKSQQIDTVTWVDVSKAVDKMCFVGSLLVTILSNVGFILVIANKSNKEGT